MNEWMNEWMNKWMNEWMNEWINKETSKYFIIQPSLFFMKQFLRDRILRVFTKILTTAWRWTLGKLAETLAFYGTDRPSNVSCLQGRPATYLKRYIHYGIRHQSWAAVEPILQRWHGVDSTSEALVRRWNNAASWTRINWDVCDICRRAGHVFNVWRAAGETDPDASFSWRSPWSRHPICARYSERWMHWSNVG